MHMEAVKENSNKLLGRLACLKSEKDTSDSRRFVGCSLRRWQWLNDAKRDAGQEPQG